jgi:hypothetical protein
MKRDERFGLLFEWVVARFRKVSTPVVVVHGPRAFGKGESVERLVAHIRDTGAKTGDVLWDAAEPVINGRYPDAAMTRLRAVAEARREGRMNGRWVFFENLDIFFDQIPGEPQVIVRLNEERLRLVAELLVAANAADPADLRGPDLRMVVTMTRAPAAIFESSHAVSAVLLPAYKVALAEHPRAWRESLHQTLKAWFPRSVADEVEEGVWRESDGHPALLRAAVEGLGAVRGEKPLPPVAGLAFAARMAMLMEGTAPILRQLRRLRSSELPLAVRAVEVLTDQLASRPDEPLGALPNTVDLLWEAGLLHPLERIGQYRLAAGVLREVLRDELGLPSMRLVVDDDATRQQLHLEVVTPDGTVRRTTLAGNSYVIGVALLAPDASVVSLEALRERLSHAHTGEGLRERGAITALHRFLREVKSLSPAADLVENVRGVGYRLAAEKVEVVRRTAE